MVGIYFSGTGNTKYCVKKFLESYAPCSEMYSIENPIALEKINSDEEILFAYFIQFSSLPKLVHDYIIDNKDIWRGKKIFIISTMGLFSGDGCGLSARLFRKYGATIIGGLHLKMPDSVADEKALKRPLAENKELIHRAMLKLQNAVECINDNSPTQEGLGFLYHLAGLFGQRLYFGHKTKKYSDKLKIDHDKCIGCGKCVVNCPTKNIELEGSKACAKKSCTMCYRCITYCPVQAITLLGNRVIEQAGIEKYIDE